LESSWKNEVTSGLIMLHHLCCADLAPCARRYGIR
jgi:hypothetical protein